MTIPKTDLENQPAAYNASQGRRRQGIRTSDIFRVKEGTCTALTSAFADQRWFGCHRSAVEYRLVRSAP